MATTYRVVGGKYADTGFEKLADGRQEERYGPLQSCREAQALWQQIRGNISTMPICAIG